MRYQCTFCDHETDYTTPDTIERKYGEIFPVYICKNCGKKIHRSPLEVDLTKDEMVEHLAHKFGMENHFVINLARYFENYPNVGIETASALYVASYYQALEELYQED